MYSTQLGLIRRGITAIQDTIADVSSQTTAERMAQVRELIADSEADLAKLHQLWVKFMAELSDTGRISLMQKMGAEDIRGIAQQLGELKARRAALISRVPSSNLQPAVRPTPPQTGVVEREEERRERGVMPSSIDQLDGGNDPSAQRNMGQDS